LQSGVISILLLQISQRQPNDCPHRNALTRSLRLRDALVRRVW